MDWLKLVNPGIIALLGSAVGLLVGHMLAIRQSRKTLIFEKKIDHAGDFLAQAQINLKHVVSVRLKGEAIGRAISDAQELIRLGKRTSFYLSKKSADAVDQYADDFFNAVWVLGQEQTVAENYFNPFSDKLADLRTTLRAEIRVEG